MASKAASNQLINDEGDTSSAHVNSDGSEKGKGNDDDGSASTSHQSDSSGTRSSTLTAKQETEIAKAESDAVFRLRLVLITLLLASAAAVAFGVYKITSEAEYSEFSNKYDDDASKIFESVAANMHSTLGAIDAFVVGIVSMAKAADQSWPFVTVPDFAIRAAKLRSTAHTALTRLVVVVNAAQRVRWETYSSQSKWVEESLETQKNDQGYKGTVVDPDNYTALPIVPIWDYQGQTPYNSTGPFHPFWQQAPVVPDDSPVFNFDVYSLSFVSNSFDQWAAEKGAFIGAVSNVARNGATPEEAEATESYWEKFIRDYIGEDEDPSEPFSDIYYPILESFADSVYNPGNPDEPVVGSLSVTYFFKDLIRNILPNGSDGIVAVIENDCDQTFSYQINGPDTLYLGPGDHHDPAYVDFKRTVQLVELDSFAPGDSYSGLKLSARGCQYTMHTYPSKTMEEAYQTDQPLIFCLVTVVIFVFTSAVFIMYDILVERRQKKVMKSAMQTGAIVSSLFPKNVRDRLLKEEEANANKEKQVAKAKNSLQSFMRDGSKPKETAAYDMLSGLDDRPIADLFPDCTVMFADIAGFTAWSSTREPSQVFTLLENIYGAFDRVADRRRVFKVETIGDSYVAACGLPDARKDHAVVMARFANDCREKFAVLTQNLETKLGPDTADLAMRFGLHSGPVTAGVLRGQKSRFQLFGDTVNTSARMESTGSKNMIQVSQTTADCLVKAGKQLWLRPREDKVEAKGKGLMQTYWCEPKSRGSSVYSLPMFPSSADSSTVSVSDNESTGDTSDSPMQAYQSGKAKRMIDWNVEILSRFIRQIVARRKVAKASAKKWKKSSKTEPSWDCGEKQILDEVLEIIELPEFDGRGNDDLVFEPLSEAVSDQLYDYVCAIERTYHSNPFHNFEHCSHVGMSAAKLMSRIMSASPVYDTEGNIQSQLHDHTYGITSDPLTQFACLFSALIHDADHPGVPNTQLVKENTQNAQRYKGRSVAEQNSVDLAWNLLIEPKYNDLRQAICETEEEKRRFRQLLVNSVMATDIMDKELKELRNSRWEKAFDGSTNESGRDNINRKATIVIEHLIQASDVAHTMQHWHIYRKWNERLFQEMHRAYEDGRSETDPSENWYKGELGFFDFYIIPLAKKLAECGVFGVSSDEYLNYAHKNRDEWEQRGEEELKAMINRLKKKQRVDSVYVHREEVLHIDEEGPQEDVIVELKG